MKKYILFLALLTNCTIASAQNLDSLFENGEDKRITEIYKSAGGSFGNNEFEIVAAAYDRLGQLKEEDTVLDKLISRFPLFLTYMTPSGYNSYSNFINAGLMEKYRASITRQYLRTIRDTSLGRKILNAFYPDQSVRYKYEDNEYRKKKGLQMKWEPKRLMKEWASTDSANALLIAQIIHDYKGFPSKATIDFIGAFSLFILMQHLDIKWRDRYDQVLFEAACKKDIAMADYAMYKTMTLVRTHQIPDSLFQKSLDSLSELKCK